MTRLLIVVGGAIFALMGAYHGALTLRDVARPTAFTPRDPALRAAMQASSIRLHPSINLWRAWLGFSLTHSLGLVLFGGALVYVGLVAPEAFAASALVQAVAVVVAAIYLALSAEFFFYKPTIGAAVGLVCFLAATVIGHTPMSDYAHDARARKPASSALSK